MVAAPSTASSGLTERSTTKRTANVFFYSLFGHRVELNGQVDWGLRTFRDDDRVVWKVPEGLDGYAMRARRKSNAATANLCDGSDRKIIDGDAGMGRATCEMQ